MDLLSLFNSRHIVNVRWSSYPCVPSSLSPRREELPLRLDYSRWEKHWWVRFPYYCLAEDT
jgi:hypothetical protein